MCSVDFWQCHPHDKHDKHDIHPAGYVRPEQHGRKRIIPLWNAKIHLSVQRRNGNVTVFIDGHVDYTFSIQDDWETGDYPQRDL